MRFKAEPETDVIAAHGLWCVIDTELDGVDIGADRWFTEQEAKAIEFALNTLERGGTLRAEFPVERYVQDENGETHRRDSIRAETFAPPVQA